MKKHLPNLITLLNLVSGVLALYMVYADKPRVAVILVLIAALFDFLDGFAARLLGVVSETGKQLDALADIVSFGLVPTFFIFKMIVPLSENIGGEPLLIRGLVSDIMGLTVLFVPFFSAIRLARFNVSGEQEFFSGLPTPANALFWTGIYAETLHTGTLYGQNNYGLYLWILMILSSLLLIAPLPMLSLKFKSFSLRANPVRYSLIIFGILMLTLMSLSALPLIILTYILLSLFKSLIT